ncbi:dentin matrix acidic phosphoprotein 1-like [Apus apus]|uniref:dentin matrix acidic phosphoprotein 1-like n=1 Tax=Apus apus TaxID=8895 RepID=UPI0021F8817F|nr:dentin matrix acidic phosphoprotein 1-like [Apus apus]
MQVKQKAIKGSTTTMRAVFLVLLLWAVAWAHPVPGHQPARRRAQQEDTASEDDINNLGNLLAAGDGRHPPVSAERGDNALAGDPAGGNAVGEELGEQGGQNKGGRSGEAQHLNRVDHEDTSARDGNGLGFLEEDAGDADPGDHGEHHGPGVHGLPSRADGFLEEEDDSGDDTLDEEMGEGPTYLPGAEGAGEHGQDVSGGAGGGHGDSSSSSSSESVGADHRSQLGSRYERPYRWGGGSSSSQEDEESYPWEDEAMQGDDPSVFDNPSSSYRGHRVGPRAPGSSRESVLGVGSHGWEEDDSRSPEVEGTDSGEDSPSTEDNSQSEEPVASQSEENSASPSREDGEDSPSREDEDSESREGTTDGSDEEPGESPEDTSQEVVSTSSERSSSRSWEGQEGQETAEDRSAPSVPDSESGEEEGDQSKSTEDTVEESEEEENDSTPDGQVLRTSDESQSTSSDSDGSQEDTTGEDSRSPESDNSESQEDNEEGEESHSQEDATRESSSRGDDSSLQSLESGSRKRRVGAFRNKPAADYDDNDCQDGY